MRINCYVCGMKRTCLPIIIFFLSSCGSPTQPEDHSNKEDSFEYIDSSEIKRDIYEKKYKAKIKSQDSLVKVWKLYYRYRLDEFTGTKFFTPLRAPYYSDVNFIYPYLSITKNGDLHIRTLFQYSADNWLFIESIKILFDTEPIEYFFKFERDNGSGVIWEYADVGEKEFTTHDLEMIYQSKICKVRYEGRQYYKDRVLTDVEKDIVQGVLKDYHIYMGDEVD